MTLDGNDHLQQRVGVITMVRRAEFPSAWSSLDSVLPQLGPRVHHFILLNNRRDVAVGRGAGI